MRPSAKTERLMRQTREIPKNEDEFIEYLKNEGWVVDEEGDVYCCEECMKEKNEDENE